MRGTADAEGDRVRVPVEKVAAGRATAAPAWLTAPADAGGAVTLEVPVASLGGAVAGRIWAPSGTPDDAPLPLLVVHDGPDYDSLASLTHYLGAGIAAGWLPKLRAALLSAGDRNSWYSANVRYARALTEQVMPALTGLVATTTRVGMGTSLGALAMLHAHCRRPGTFGGLFLQSASFFVPRLDPQERRFRYYRRITAFTAALEADGVPGVPVPVSLTCGSIEENIANNRLMLSLLRSAGYPATLHEVRAEHNFTAWRDALHPWLTELLQQVCG
jgi:enterochelin esterase-like enzyme